MKIDRDLVGRVCKSLADGESLRKSCEAEGVAMSTFLGWVTADDEVGDQYARARATGSDIQFEALLEQAAEPAPCDATGKTDSGWVQWKRLQIDTAKWVLARKRPTMYGDRVEQHHTGSVGLSIAIDLGAKQ